VRIAVIGAGGLGGYFGARIALGGRADVHFVARGAHLAAMREQGLRIEGPTPLHLPAPSVTDDPRTIGAVDVVMLCVKLWDTEAAIEQARSLMGPASAIVSFQNGVTKDEPLIDAFGAACVMGGVGYIAATIETPGTIRQTGPMQRLVFGEFDGSRSPRARTLLDACVAGGVDAELSTDILREIWQKFVFLAGLSGTTASMRRTIGPIRENPRTRAFLLDVMREVVAVGRACGVDLPADQAEAGLARADAVSPQMTSSLHHDLERGNRLEVRWAPGAVVRLGERHGVPTPLNRAIAAILELHADGATG